MALVEPEHPDISVSRQAELLGISRSSIYYKPVQNEEDVVITRLIDEIYTEAPFYGSRKIKAALARRGHVVGLERVQDFLDAAKLLKGGDFEFYLAGDGYQKQGLLTKVSREKTPVKYLGCLPRSELRQLLAKMHIGVAPMEKEEVRKFSSSIKTYEYLSMGLPVVCADVGSWG